MLRFSVRAPKWLATLLLVWAVLPSTLFADSKIDEQKVQAAVSKGVEFLKTTQGEDGSWTSPTSLGVTGLATYSLLVSGVLPDDAVVAAALKKIESNIQADGGIYQKDSTHKNYETAICLQALIAANQDGRYQQKIDKAVAFLKDLQWDETETGNREHVAFGGAGYGRSARPDLSNTVFFLDALKAAGVPSSDPAVQKTLVFVSRCQNLPGPHNQTEFADKIKDGGFYYTPAAGGASPAGKTPEGGLRSYASMTYAGLRSMIYAGLTAEDPRVKAAQSWLQQFYSLDENPGMGQQGLYYYYQIVAKTMNALGNEEFADAKGEKHPWREELLGKLLARQKENGSWVNANDRWMEGDPNLVTAYALITLHQLNHPTSK